MDQAKETGVQTITIQEVLVVQVPINLNMVAMEDMVRVVVVVHPVQAMVKIKQLVIQIIGVNNSKMVGQHNNNNGQIKVKQL